MRLMGFKEDQIEKELGFCRDDNPDFELWPEHVDAFRLFLSVQQRWVYPAMCTRPVSLDCEWVKLKAELMFPEKRRLEIISQLECIEAGALNAWPKK